MERIDAAVKRRSESDRIMGNVWMVVPFLPLLAGIIYVVAFIGFITALVSANFLSASVRPEAFSLLFVSYGALLLLSAFLLIIGVILGAASIYYLIDRRNKHFLRQRTLVEAVASFLRSRQASGSNAELFEPLELAFDESTYFESERPAAVWALLFVFVTPLAMLVAGYFLTDDLQGHRHRQNLLIGHLMQLSARLDLGLEMPAGVVPGRERDELLYLVITLITGGLFWIYWFQVLLKDFNNHFRNQWIIEDRLVMALRSRFQISSELSKRCASCGSSMPATAVYCPTCGQRKA